MDGTTSAADRPGTETMDTLPRHLAGLRRCPTPPERTAVVTGAGTAFNGSS